MVILMVFALISVILPVHSTGKTWRSFLRYQLPLSSNLLRSDSSILPSVACSTSSASSRPTETIVVFLRLALLEYQCLRSPGFPNTLDGIQHVEISWRYKPQRMEKKEYTLKVCIGGREGKLFWAVKTVLTWWIGKTKIALGLAVIVHIILRTALVVMLLITNQHALENEPWSCNVDSLNLDAATTV